MAGFPVAPTRRAGWLAVGDGHEIHWHEAGNPDGLPVVLLHGGPGSGSRDSTRRHFDPARFRIIGFDQRGCGQSRPHAGDGLAALEANSTAHLVADLELLRAHLGISRWALFGHSWGVTLGLAYAEAHPERVLGAVFVGVTTTRRREIDWLYHGLAPLFPAEWAAFVAGAPAGTDETRLLAAYHGAVMADAAARHLPAALAFHAWDTASVSATGAPAMAGTVPGAAEMRQVLGRARIVTHYFTHGAFLAEGQLLAAAHRLRGIPGWLVNGRLDLQSPLTTAWELARAWPEAQLVVVDNAGHATGDPGMEGAIATAIAALAETVGGPAAQDGRNDRAE